MKTEKTNIDIDADALRILKETEKRIRETRPDMRVNYSVAIRELAKRRGLKSKTEDLSDAFTKYDTMTLVVKDCQA